MERFVKRMRIWRISHEEIVQIYQEHRNALDKTVSDIVQLLDKRAQKIAFAESCTGGMLSQQLTAVSGASSVYELGLCTYSNTMKERFLGVPHETLEKYDAVSPQTAQAMAEGLRTLSEAALCVTVTGFAGPGGGTEQYPVGTVFVGVLYEDHLCIAHLQLHRLGLCERGAVRMGAAVCAFGIALKMLMEESECRM